MPEPLEKKYQELEPEPEPLEKKPGAAAGATWEKKSGAGAAKNLPAPQPCEKIKGIRKL